MLSTFTTATKPKEGEAQLAQIAEEKRVRKTSEVFMLFTMGSQFDHLIKAHLDSLGVYCLVANPASVTAEDVYKVSPIGIIISGGPASVFDEPPPFDHGIFGLGTPVFGICLGYQMWAKHVGATVAPCPNREFGVHVLELWNAELNDECPLLENLTQRSDVLMSHGDVIERGVSSIRIHGSTTHSGLAVGSYGHLWGVQFHPECTETTYGRQMFENFCFKICQAKDRFPSASVAERKVAEIREQVGDKKVLLALSGGSDSSVVAYLLKRALEGSNGQVRAVYIRGIDRPDDERHVHEYFGSQPWLEVKIVDATEQFLEALKGITTMKLKRRAMKEEVYVKVLKEEATRFGATFIAQGTLYTDLSESGLGYQTGARKAVIKEHHNTDIDWSPFVALEPLKDLVKDSGRTVGREVGVPEALLTRHPFPGPGLVIRVEGEVTAEGLRLARKLDDIYIEELRRWKLYDSVWQAGINVTVSSHTDTKGDGADVGAIVMYWAVWSVNGFTARWVEFPNDFRRHLSRRIGNECREVGAVVYRETDKPYATIEQG